MFTNIKLWIGMKRKKTMINFLLTCPFIMQCEASVEALEHCVVVYQIGIKKTRELPFVPASTIHPSGDN